MKNHDITWEKTKQGEMYVDIIFQLYIHVI